MTLAPARPIDPSPAVSAPDVGPARAFDPPLETPARDRAAVTHRLRPVRSRLRAAVPDLVCAVVVLVVARSRYRRLADGGGLSGFDAGNWLAFADSLLGHGSRSSSLTYPPVVPLLAHASVELWGLTVGLARLAAIVSMLPAIGVYLVVRASGHRWVAVFVALLVAASSAVGEATAWGGYPQLIGLGILPVVAWRWDLFCTSARRRDAVGTGVGLALLLATSHFLALVAVLGLGALTGLHLLHRARRRALLASWRRSLLVAVPVAPLVPYYLRLGGAISGPVNERRSLLTNPFNHARLDELLFIARESPTLWRLVFLAPVVVVAFAAGRHRESALCRISIAGLLAAVIAMAYLGDPRVVYVYPTFAVTSLAVVLIAVIERVDAADAVRRSGSRRVAMSAGAALALAGVVAHHIDNGLAFFDIQRNYYGVVNPYVEESLHWLHDNTPRDALVATPPIQGGPWGWWIEGVAQRHTLVGSQLLWLNFEDEQRRARASNAIFAAFPSTDALALARSDGVRYLVVPDNWERFDAYALAEFTGAHPELVAFRNARVTVLAVPAS